MCAGFTPNAHDAPCRKRASESKQNQWDRARSPKGESSIISEPTPVWPITRRQGTNLRTHWRNYNGSERVATAGPYNKPMNSPLEGKSASCNLAGL